MSEAPLLVRGILIAPFILFALCASRLEAQTSSPDAAVYTAVLRHADSASSEPDLVFDSTSTAHVSGSRVTPERTGGFWDMVPKDVQHQFVSLNQAPQSLRKLALPSRIRLLSLAEWQERKKADARASVVDIGSVAVVSRIAYTADSTRALVQVAWPCDGPCGQAKYYWLRRGSSGDWVVQAETVAWSG